MGYNKLGDSGMDDDARLAEASRILEILKDVPAERATARERGFLAQMRAARFVSTNQLFWLRDLKDKYL